MNNFYSIDKLVEFGMGVAVANQMVNSMNQAIDKMKIPGSGNPITANVSPVYYAVIDGKCEGPYSLTELSRLIADKKIVKETYVWKPGMASWDIVQNVSEVLSLVALTPPPVPGI